MSTAESTSSGADKAETGYRSLLERLYTLADHLPVSHVIDISPAGKIVAALAHFVEHGEAILDAADDDLTHLSEQLRTHSPAMRTPATNVSTVLNAPYPQPVDSAANASLADDRIAALEAQIHALTARKDVTPATVETNVPDSDPRFSGTEAGPAVPSRPGETLPPVPTVAETSAPLPDPPLEA